MKVVWCVLSAAMVCLLAPSAAWGHDELPPPWRGDDPDRMTLQVWTFDDNDDPAAPEQDLNPFGTASADITVGDFGSGWQWDMVPGEQRGYWDLGVGGTIVLDIPNSEEEGPFKEIWIQITYIDGPVLVPEVTVPGGTQVGGESGLVIEDYFGPGAWLLDRWTFRIEPNPTHEQIVITAGSMGATIDQIVVDTWCVPEPASVVLLALGGLAILVRRFKN